MKIEPIDLEKIQSSASQSDTPYLLKSDTYPARGNHNVAFGLTLRKLRTSQNLTQETLAFAVNLDRTYISLLEQGRRSPTLDTVVALCRGLDFSIVEFLSIVESRLVPAPTE
ncbi:XRE family transcriptional regulator [Burkholderia sp. Bp9031]|uniref:helix-turn-helix domain-containing protein n=1 Tax=Burkholderia sp. Bp9031 TaxID=2184566 RepID=UPI000F5E17A5|nr:helix-turn-helix transcriptional regulator [Burkholderia sp. Bp9031]RQZ15561.1 XRE family transcriptional regulator [Burkholderia sp. Bp9031]